MHGAPGTDEDGSEATPQEPYRSTSIWLGYEADLVGRRVHWNNCKVSVMRNRDRNGSDNEYKMEM